MNVTNFKARVETWADIRAIFWEIMQDSEAAQQFFTETQITNWANKALREMATATIPLEVRATFSTVSESPLYGLGSRAMKIFRLEIDNWRLGVTSEDKLFKSDRNWRTIGGDPKAYYISQFTDSDDLVFGLYPEPRSVLDGIVYYRAKPPTVSSSTDTSRLQVPSWAVWGVLYSMLSDAYLAEGRRHEKTNSSYKYYKMLFNDIVDRLAARSRAKLNKAWVYGSKGTRPNYGIRMSLPNMIQAGPDAPENFGDTVSRTTSATATAIAIAAGTGFSLYWDEGAADVDHFSVYRGKAKTNMQPFATLATTFDPTADGWTDTTATDVGLYYFQVTATNTMGYESWKSDYFTLTVT